MVKTVLLIMLSLLLPYHAGAAFSSGSTGADGAFAPTTSTVLISKNGVFNFTTVTIPTGVTVTFPKNTPEYTITLATGNVTINGAISLNGSDAS